MLTAAVPTERRRDGHTRSSIPLSTYTGKRTTPVKNVFTSTPTTTPRSEPQPLAQLSRLATPTSESQPAEQDSFGKILEEFQPPGADETRGCNTNETEQTSGLIVHSLDGFGVEEARRYDERYQKVLLEMDDEDIRHEEGGASEAKEEVDALDLFEGIFSPFKSKRRPKIDFVEDAYRREQLESHGTEHELFPSVFLEPPACGQKKSLSRPQLVSEDRVPGFISPGKHLIDSLPSKTDISKSEQMQTKSTKHQHAPKIIELRSLFEKENSASKILPNPSGNSVPKIFPTLPPVFENVGSPPKMLPTPLPVLENETPPSNILPKPTLPPVLEKEDSMPMSLQTSTLPTHLEKENFVPNPVSPFDYSTIVLTGDIQNDIFKNDNIYHHNRHQGAMQNAPANGYGEAEKTRQRTVPTLDELRSMTDGIERLTKEGCDPKIRGLILKGAMLMFHDGPRPRPWQNPKPDPINLLRQITPEKSMSCSEQKSVVETYLHGDDDDVGDQVKLEAVHVEEQSIAENALAGVSLTERKMLKREPHRDHAEHSWDESDGAKLREIMLRDGPVADDTISEDHKTVNGVAFALDNIGALLKHVGNRMEARWNANRVSVQANELPDALDNMEKFQEEVEKDASALQNGAELLQRVGSMMETPCNAKRASVQLPDVLDNMDRFPEDVDKDASALKNGVGPVSMDLDSHPGRVHVPKNMDPNISDSDSRFGEFGTDTDHNDTSSKLCRVPSTCHRSTMIEGNDQPDWQTVGSNSLLRRSYLFPAIMLLFVFLTTALPSAICSTYTVLDACFSTKTIDRREILGVLVEMERFSRWESRPAVCREIGGGLGPAAVLANFMMDNFLTCEVRESDDWMDPS